MRHILCCTSTFFFYCSRPAANEYSTLGRPTLDESIVPAEYEVPFILSPTAEKHHHPHSDDSAAPSVTSSEKEIGQDQPTGTEGEYFSIEPK